MMDVREKLVELLGNIYLPMMDGHNTIGEYNIPHKFKEKIADYLISNGVTVQENVKMSDELLKQLKNAPIMICKSEPSIETVQEWISVKDRLPELGERVICTDGYAVFEQYRVESSCVYGMWDRFGLKSPMQEVTHWMSLPEPPKGE